MLHRTRLQERECQQTVDGLNGSMCMQFLATYLRSLKHRMVYNTPKYVANSGLSSLHDPRLKYPDPARWAPRLPAR